MGRIYTGIFSSMNLAPEIIITTRLPPLACGIGTYSWLAHKYRPNNAELVRFLVMEGARESQAILGWEAITEFNGDAKKLGQELGAAGATNILLHYAGRGYHRFGCPTWLPAVLRSWKKTYSDGHLTIFFHEVPGDPPRKPQHFLLGKIQRRIVRQLASLADVLITNTEAHGKILRTLSRRNEVHCLPVGSNIELNGATSPPRRETEFMVFGLPFGRKQTLQAFETQIRRWNENALLSKLHLVGPENEKLAAEATPLLKDLARIVVLHGLLQATDVSLLLQQTQFVLTNVTRDTWSKSSVFMACAAHGCSVVIKKRETEIPLCYAVAENEIGCISPADLEGRASKLRDWYKENAAWPVIARRLANLSQRSGVIR